MTTDRHLFIAQANVWRSHSVNYQCCCSPDFFETFSRHWSIQVQLEKSSPVMPIGHVYTKWWDFRTSYALLLFLLTVDVRIVALNHDMAPSDHEVSSHEILPPYPKLPPKYQRAFVALPVWILAFSAVALLKTRTSAISVPPAVTKSSNLFIFLFLTLGTSGLRPNKCQPEQLIDIFPLTIKFD